MARWGEHAPPTMAPYLPPVARRAEHAPPSTAPYFTKSVAVMSCTSLIARGRCELRLTELRLNGCLRPSRAARLETDLHDHMLAKDLHEQRERDHPNT